MLVQKAARQVFAYRLGDGSDVERQLLEAGKLKRQPDGSFLVFSQETDGQGQMAQIGDYIKVDSAGYPYPNDREYFLNRHVLLEGDLYLQTSEPLRAWTAEEPLCPEIEFLLARRQLQIQPGEQAHYFSAFLWGAQLYAARNAVVIFDRVQLDAAGAVAQVDFHFIAWDEFEKTYTVLQPL